MLREQVLVEWRNCKEKHQKEHQFLKFLATQSLEETVLPCFPLGIEACRQRLDHWTDLNYQAKLMQHKSTFIAQEKNFGEISEPLSFLSLAYIDKINMFNELVKGWKKERDSNNGPTIEEVD